jgi:hypothetical protein
MIFFGSKYRRHYLDKMKSQRILQCQKISKNPIKTKKRKWQNRYFIQIYDRLRSWSGTSTAKQSSEVKHFFNYKL